MLKYLGERSGKMKKNKKNDINVGLANNYKQSKDNQITYEEIVQNILDNIDYFVKPQKKDKKVLVRKK